MLRHIFTELWPITTNKKTSIFTTQSYNFDRLLRVDFIIERLLCSLDPIWQPPWHGSTWNNEIEPRFCASFEKRRNAWTPRGHLIIQVYLDDTRQDFSLVFDFNKVRDEWEEGCWWNCYQVRATTISWQDRPKFLSSVEKSQSLSSQEWPALVVFYSVLRAL